MVFCLGPCMHWQPHCWVLPPSAPTRDAADQRLLFPLSLDSCPTNRRALPSGWAETTRQTREPCFATDPSSRIPRNGCGVPHAAEW
jgi:hypothetical protein